ncbi:site-specific DNA-methyltransferase [Orbus wheelerorum]|uniref:DNA-methyltransferase n=1 Tax=Orbus wheelerorum TaxID=3074111 RepID=UPI00370D6911
MTSKKNQEIKINDLILINDDCLNVLKSLPDNHIDLILTDPPYFKVKSNSWDNQWQTEADYLAWLDDIFAEFWRVLKPNGSLYCFCGSRLSAETELLVKQRFNVLNHIVWSKPNGPWLRQHKESLRSYFPASERIIFAEHYNAEGKFKGQSGYAVKCSELRQSLFAPLIEYFKSARELLGISAADINIATGTQMCSHWFSYSQWQLPSEKQYADLQSLFNRVAKEKGIANPLMHDHNVLADEYSLLHKNYQILSLQYDDLKAQYELLRRPFLVSKKVPYIDVWTYAPVPYYKGKHPCEKPAAMLEDVINASSRPGDIVADFFMGSGSTLKAAKKLGRKGIGVEFEEECFMKTVSELTD